MAIVYDISTSTNLSFSLIVNWETFSNGASGSPIPVDLTGYQAIMQVRQFPGSPVALFTVGSFPSSGIVLNVPSTGSISINVNPVNYINIGTGVFAYDLLLIDPLGNQTVILMGSYTLNPGVSQNATVPPSPAPPNSVTVVNLDITNTLSVLGAATFGGYVSIAGGSIEGVTIGETDPNPGYFTVLTNSASAAFTNVNITGYLIVPADSTGVTAPSGTNNDYLATTAFVNQELLTYQPTYLNNVVIGNLFPSYGAFTALSGQTLNVTASGSIYDGTFTNPTLLGTTYTATAASGTNNTEIASTGFVNTAVAAASAAVVVSFDGRTGPVTLYDSDVVYALGYTPANIYSPMFLGTPMAPTASAGTNTQQLATTAYVQMSVVAASGYNSYDVDISGGMINGTEIGNMYPSTGAFTNLSAEAIYASGGMINGTIIGTENPSTGMFGTFIRTINPSASASGTIQSTAYPIMYSMTVITAASSGASGVILPMVDVNGNAIEPGTIITIFNRSQVGIGVFPFLGSQIEFLGENNPSGLYPNDTNDYIYAGTNQWYIK